ncbi:MAG: copper resistance protein CopC/CopD [Chloroflexi bacterium]|nr:copper resistance protein CopC/CopD [Chloroflexota bacterium]
MRPHPKTNRQISRIISGWTKLALIAVLLLVLSAPRAVNAHGYIVRSIPEDRASLERAPARVSYWFSEELEPDFSSITVRDATGEIVATGGVAPESGVLLSARLPSGLPNGAYVVDLRLAFASDGHVIAESRTFFIGEAAGGAASSSANWAAVPWEVVWRAALLVCTLLLFGTFTVYTLVLVPAWGSASYTAGRLPPRVMRRLNGLVIVGLIGAFAASIAALLQQSSVFFGADVGRVLGEGLWNVVRIGTRFGDTWNARMLLLALIAALFGASLYVRREYPNLVYPLWVASAWGMALVLGAWSVSAHAAGSLTLAWIALISDWVHGLAAGFWAGGLAALTLVLPVALQPYTGDQRRQVIVAALNRFSPVAAAGLVVVVATGVYNALNWFYRPADIGTSYGGTLLLKLLFVALLIAIGALHRMALAPERYERFLNLTRRVRAFLPTLQLESALAVVVLIAAGWLSATPPPDPNLAGENTPVPRVTADLNGVTLNGEITPGGPGVNSYDVLLTQNSAPIEAATARIRLVDPTRDWRGAWHPLDPVGDGLYAAVGDDLNQAGDWWALIDVGEQRAAFVVNVSEEAAVIRQRPPNALQGLALVGVLGALGFAAYPLARRGYRKLDRSPASIVIALGATAATVVITVIGIGAALSSQSEYEAVVSPPPTVVNVVLPDQASLERGQAALAAACAGWSADPTFGALIGRLERTRDEELYAMTRDGWRTLLPCAALDDSMRWDVVNYLRSLEGSS